uniref:(California timema) hypothetical protein n=1 Tax=Timema californicum TaxID=61474 RepID=A0A7R9J5E0_TIMCA|nr:unnamed protein product [Timema californicum]
MTGIFGVISWSDVGWKNPLDLRHIDPEFTREPVSASVGCSQSHSTCVLSASVREADDAFAGFSYAPPIDL